MTDASRGRAGGFGDWLPGAAGRRRGVGDALLGTFEAWGYGLVATPLVEPVDTIAEACHVAAGMVAPVSAAANELGCDRKTVFRDLEVLEQIGVPLYQDQRGPRSRWRVVTLSWPEMLALTSGRELLAGLAGRRRPRF